MRNATASAGPPRQKDGLRQGYTLVASLIAVMWASEVVDTIASHRLDRLGIEPRDGDGLIGVVAAPFLHSGFGHLIGNTIPLGILGVLLAIDGARRVAVVTALVAVISGLGVWLLGASNSLHIGASGVVFGWITYLVSRGYFSRNLLHLGVGALVLIVYGTTILFGVLPKVGVSWQGHLFGAVGGVLTAYALHTARERA